MISDTVPISMPGGNESEYPLVTTESPLATFALFGMLFIVTCRWGFAIPLDLADLSGFF